MRLDKLLIGHGVITQEQAEDAERHMQEHGVRFGEALVACGVLTPDQVEAFLMAQQQIGAASIFSMSKAVLRMTQAVVRSTAARNGST